MECKEKSLYTKNPATVGLLFKSFGWGLFEPEAFHLVLHLIFWYVVLSTLNVLFEIISKVSVLLTSEPEK